MEQNDPLDMDDILLKNLIPKYEALRARCDKMEQALEVFAESNCDYEDMNIKKLHSTECRACKAKELLKALDEQEGKEPVEQVAVWVKASEFKFEVGMAYHAKDSKSKGAGRFDDFGNFFWGDNSMTPGDSQDDLLILDEAGKEVSNG